jgi:transaldolase/glucose-6-phosphate isomerase
MEQKPKEIGRNLLIAMDNTPESIAMVRVVAHQLPEPSLTSVTLMHYIAPLFWEHDGGTSPEKQKMIHKEMEEFWKKERELHSRTLSHFDRAQIILQDVGVPAEQIDRKIFLDENYARDAILNELHRGAYSTLVVGGHQNHSLFHILDSSIAGYIQRHARDIQIWIVETPQVVSPADAADMESPVFKLQSFGQSVWLDYIRRGMLNSGEFWHLILEEGLRGVTSNPSIFDKAIAGSTDYDQTISSMAHEGKGVEEVAQALMLQDVRHAADLLHPVYRQTDGRDGFVSIEVSPLLAHDTKGTIKEARRLWDELYRPNIMIKVPGTREGLPAIQQLIREGINVNVTLLFSLKRYAEVVDAYLKGLEERLKAGEGIEDIASVASFFLSRIDVITDPLLEKIIKEGGDHAKLAESLHGETAVASAKAAYKIYQELFNSERFQTLSSRGAHSQRLLWASTSTKNPAYSDIKYMEALIGSETVTTVPIETLIAYRDHGQPKARLIQEIDEAETKLKSLAELGIDLDELTQQLEDEGVEKFAKSFEDLHRVIEKKYARAHGELLDTQSMALGETDHKVQKRLSAFQKEKLASRIWEKDPSCWEASGADPAMIKNSLGWLHVAEKMETNIDGLEKFASDIRSQGFTHVVHMGMGGSSLTPLLFERVFTKGKEGLPLIVLDTVDPATVLRVEREIEPENTLFIVASKSGTTTEPLALGDYFYGKLETLKGERAGENFIAITDPETPLAEMAKKRGFRQVFLNFKDIGGRYSALSYFGLVPAVLMGVDVRALLNRSIRMMQACESSVQIEENPAVVLGAALGELALKGRDKVTLLAQDRLAPFGMWLEQLLAESTGKDGKGLLPVVGEKPDNLMAYGQDRVFIYLRYLPQEDFDLDRVVDSIRDSGHPVVTIEVNDLLNLGQEFFRWELATAVVGKVLGINPFDQPNVQESKDNAKRLLEKLVEQGELPQEQPAVVEDGLSLYGVEGATSLGEGVKQFLEQAKGGDYVALQAYFAEEPETETALQVIRHHIRDTQHVATTVGYGPRFLHSTGQYHKGGPDTGLFLQLTADDVEDEYVPGRGYTLGQIKHAKALGDLQALRQHGRRVIRVHLGEDILAGLSTLLSKLKSVAAIADQ